MLKKRLDNKQLIKNIIKIDNNILIMNNISIVKLVLI